MRIDQAVKDSTGRALIEKGAYLDDFQIEYLLDKGIGGIYISEGEADPDELELQIPQYTKDLIQKERKEDRKKVRLNAEVIERVGKGVQYLFDNSDSENLSEATNNVSNELIKVISDSDAVAVDINLIKVSDEYTFKHSVDVATMAMIIGKNYGLEQEELRELCTAGLLHDLGKSKIPLEVLNKPGKLDDNEFALMKQHSLFGFKILKERNEFPESIMLGVLQHHEKMNGKGYPQGVPSNRIHKYARIISVADVYDALVTKRPYKDGLPKRVAIEMIMAMTQELDIDAMRSFLKSIILYPVDSIVHLSTGEPCKVVENNKQNVLRPRVVGLKTGKVYDLANDVACASMLIVD
ncbi:MAG: HD-GYP domain-containing protein [Lachnospiraceae bacterium]|nr:HD-GYP domain-containing protein [Lachnospiraceae bacterium]